jgi:hypothetical protein
MPDALPDAQLALFLREKLKLARLALGVRSIEDLLDVLFPWREYPEEKRAVIVSRMYTWNRRGEARIQDPEFFERLRSCVGFPPDVSPQFLMRCTPREFIEHLPAERRVKAEPGL